MMDMISLLLISAAAVAAALGVAFGPEDRPGFSERTRLV